MNSSMDKHKCKLCFRNFSNGRALGGHMRSHMLNLPVPPKQPEQPPLVQLSFEADSASFSYSSSEEEEEEDKGLSYGLRENPKRSIRVVDPEFSFAVLETGSVIPQDRESETESSKNPTRRRSKRPWHQHDHLQRHHHHHHHNHKQIQEQDAFKKLKSTNKQSNNNNNKTESCWAEPEPVSSISDATTEEDVAFCLMMLSRDKWMRQKDQEKEQDEDEEEEKEQEEEEEEEEDEEAERSLEDSDEFSEELKSSKTQSVRGRYKCETCKKVFRSYQALGGHRASHKKIKVSPTTTASYKPELEQEKKIHECPVCFRVFASGQALGGHKRTHVTGSSATPVRTSTKFGDNNFIDLNLPAPVDDDDVSQIENSAVSDAEFLKTNRQIFDAQVA